MQDVVVLKGKGVCVSVGFVKDKRADNPAGRNLGIEVKRVGKLG